MTPDEKRVCEEAKRLIQSECFEEIFKILKQIYIDKSLLYEFTQEGLLKSAESIQRVKVLEDVKNMFVALAQKASFDREAQKIKSKAQL
jgi:hypothetical protein